MAWTLQNNSHGLLNILHVRPLQHMHYALGRDINALLCHLCVILKRVIIVVSPFPINHIQSDPTPLNRWASLLEQKV